MRGAQMSLDEDMRSTKSPSMARYYLELKAGIADPPRHLLPLALGTLKVRDAVFALDSHAKLSHRLRASTERASHAELPPHEQGAAMAAAILFLLASNGLFMPRPLPCHQVSILMQSLNATIRIPKSLNQRPGTSHVYTAAWVRA